MGVPTGGVSGGGGGVKRVSSELEGGGKLKEAYPFICMIQKCLLACPPSQSDCEELFSLFGTSSDVEDEEKEERMSTWVNSLTI